MLLMIMIVAALVAAVVRIRDKAEMSEEIRCGGCFWEHHCNHPDGKKLCVDGTNGWEDAPWERF